MKFKIDENLPIEVAVALREAGHDAMSVVDQGLGGHADAGVADVCRRELLGEEPLEHRLWIVEESRIRVRG
jgi:predicted nuclease of predicted toxin-antitoxin system